jgi:hypothetical protein
MEIDPGDCRAHPHPMSQQLNEQALLCFNGHILKHHIARAHAHISHPSQIAAAVVSASVQNDGDRGWTSFVLLLIELNLIVWVGYYMDR